MQPMNVVIDCDTGVDDAMALLLALRSPEFNVVGVTNVAGNVPLNKVVRNTLVVVEHARRQVPVYPGASRPMVRPSGTAEYAHGSDGLGDVGFPDPVSKPQSIHAVDFLVQTFAEATEPLHLITLGPLTNIGIALARAPELERQIASLVMMAGGINGGNTTPAAEFNVWVDPEAADIVFSSSIPNKTMVALDPIRQGGGIYSEDVEQFEAAGTPWCDMLGRLLRKRLTMMAQMFGDVRPTTPPDLAAVGVALDPTIACAASLPVRIETEGRYTRGMTVVDQREFRRGPWAEIEPNINVVQTIDNARYRKLVLDRVLAQ